MIRSLQNLALLLCSLILMAFVCEGAFYILNRLSPPTEIDSFGGTPNQERLDFFRYHPVYGYSGLPNVRKQFYGKYITHNSKGFRGPEVDYLPSEGEKRVVFVGDSQTWGWRVSDDETMPYYTSRLLNKSLPGSTYTSLNFGATGYGIGQSYLRFIAEGSRYQPDYVVLTYFADNDIEDTTSTKAYGVEKPYIYEKSDGGFCVSNVPPRRASGWPSDNLGSIIENKFNIKSFQFKVVGIQFDLVNTQTFKYFKNRSINTALFRTWGTDDSNTLAAIKKHLGCLQSEPGPQLPNWPDRVELTVKLIGLLQKAVNEAGAKFIVITKPTAHDYNSDNLEESYRIVLGRLHELSVEVIDLYSAGRIANMSGREMYLGDGSSGHLSPAGNMLVARNVARKISRDELQRAGKRHQ